MSIRDPDRDLDDLLHDDGGKMGNLYRRLPRYEPPRRLDRAVLSEAARAVHSGRPPRRQRWIVGLGSAAGLVLAAGIAWRIGHDAMNQSATPASESAPRIVPVQPISVPPRAEQEEPAPKVEEQPAEDAANGAAAGRAAADEIKQTVRKRKGAAPTAPVRTAQPPEAPRPAPAQALPPPDAFPGSARPRDRVEDSEKFGAGRVAPAESGAVVEKSAAPTAARGLASPTPPSGSVELRRDMQLAPQDWLSHIRQLMRQGRRQQAMESLRLFQRAHPDWELPDDLRPLLD